MMLKTDGRFRFGLALASHRCNIAIIPFPLDRGDQAGATLILLDLLFLSIEMSNESGDPCPNIHWCYALFICSDARSARNPGAA